MYIYIHICVFVCVHIYIYICICTHNILHKTLSQTQVPEVRKQRLGPSLRKGTPHVDNANPRAPHMLNRTYNLVPKVLRPTWGCLEPPGKNKPQLFESTFREK